MNAPLDWKDAPALARAHEQLKCLYEISKRLSQFESVEQTIPEVLALVSESVPMLTAILILEEQNPKRRRTRAIAWHTHDVEASHLREAKAHATATYSYLARKAARLEEETGARRIPSSFPPPAERTRGKFLLLPLVVHQGSIFGALQIESAATLEESDLSFINAMVGQLSVALDRLALIASQEAADKAALLAAEFLAEASMILFSSLDYEETIAMVVRAAVPRLADICFIDEVRKDGRIDRIAMAAADPTMQDRANRLRDFAAATDSRTPQAGVLRTGKSILWQNIQAQSDDLAHRTFLEELGVAAIMSVPLNARDRTIGVLTFLAIQPGRRYSEADLSLAEEVGRRAAIAMDNARLYEQARRATLGRDNLLATVSHDLRNPLGSIIMSASLLHKVTISDNGGIDAVKAIEAIERSARRMGRLIGDLLDMSSIETGHLTVDMRSHSVMLLVEEAVETHRAAATAKALRLDGDREAERGAVYCDRERILEVFDNLLSNAIKFTPEGGAIRVGAERRGEQVLFSVVDAGIGIRPDELPHVFERFWQARTTAYLGTGLGLPIAKGLVEANGGELWVESKVGVGSTFFFTLPFSREVAQPLPAMVPSKKDATSTREAPSPETTVLLVDDDADVREALGMILKGEGYNVVFATNGAEALDAVRAAKPFLILLDLTMPVMDGWAFLAERNRDPSLSSIPVIVISAQMAAESQVVEANAGYFQKPVRVDRLLKTLEDLGAHPRSPA